MPSKSASLAILGVRNSKNIFSQAFNKPVLLRIAASAIILGSVISVAQSSAAPATPTASTELPVIMKQNVVAGNTIVGTKVQASLIVATLLDGVVVPRDAVLSGEVIESEKKTKTDPSRLAIRMDSVQWKNGSAPIKAYLTAWYYPQVMSTDQNLSYQPADAANSKKTWNGQGAYPDPSNPVSQQKFPGGRDNTPETVSAPGSTASNISQHRVTMKNVDSDRDSNGILALTSSHSNIKLDKLTTYVFATADPHSTK